MGGDGAGTFPQQPQAGHGIFPTNPADVPPGAIDFDFHALAQVCVIDDNPSGPAVLDGRSPHVQVRISMPLIGLVMSYEGCIQRESP